MSENVLLDTDILSMFFRGDPGVVRNMNKHLTDNDKVYLSIITYYEILSGLKHLGSKKQIDLFLEFCFLNEVLPMTMSSAALSASLYGELRKMVTPLDDMDLLIAGIAIENRMILVTHNTKHFSRIPSLELRDWKTSES